jgi:response regulator RpfG family c-di-GMP phosphodiesterase
LVLLDKESAVKNDFFVVNQIKKMAPDIMIVVIADNADEDEKLWDRDIDEFVLRPISPDNLANKILNMLAKRELRRLKEAALYPPEYNNKITFNFS